MLFPELVQTALNDDPADANESACETKYWGLQDANFNLLAIIGDDGSFAERYEYTPYGQRTVYKESHSGDDPLLTAPILESQRWQVSSVDQPYGICDVGHQGLFFDKEWGAYDNRYRILGPTVARFFQRDPMGYDSDMSLYAAYHTRPTCLRDGHGLNPTDNAQTGYLLSMLQQVFQPLIDWENARVHDRDLMKRARKKAQEEVDKIVTETEIVKIAPENWWKEETWLQGDEIDPKLRGQCSWALKHEGKDGEQCSHRLTKTDVSVQFVGTMGAPDANGEHGTFVSGRKKRMLPYCKYADGWPRYVDKVYKPERIVRTVMVAVDGYAISINIYHKETVYVWE